MSSKARQSDNNETSPTSSSTTAAADDEADAIAENVPLLSKPGVTEYANLLKDPNQWWRRWFCCSNGRGSDGDFNQAYPFNLPAVLMIFFFPACGGFLFGYDIGSTSYALVQLETSAYSGVTWYEVVADSSALQGVITSIGVGGAMVGSLICFSIADFIGRRNSLLIASALFFTGGMIEFLSGVSTYSAGLGVSTLLIGRSVYGLGCGFAMHGAPAYIGEMAPPSIRGLLIALKEAVIVLGMLAGYFFGWLLYEEKGGWRYTYALSSIMAVVMAIGVYVLPPSARWLVLQDRLNEAAASLRFVMPDISSDAVTDVLTSQKLTRRTGSDWEALTNPVWKPALVAGIGLVLLQQITGQPSVLYYADTIFEDVGMSNFSSVLIGLFKLLATLFAVFNVDHHGRKKLLLIGCSLMLLALIVLGIAFCFDYVSESDCNAYVLSSTCDPISKCSWSSSCDDDDGCTDVDSCACCGINGLDFQKGTILTALFIYIGGYQVGFGPVSWLIIAEIFPLELRGKSISLAVVTNFFFNMLVTFFFPVELDWIGAAATFFIFAGLTLYSIYFVHTLVPETKGLTLEQIEDLFTERANNPQAHA